MSDFVQEEPDNGEEPTEEEPGEGEAWDETNDEPAQGEGGQDIV
jgi:hypothetical protein